MITMLTRKHVRYDANGKDIAIVFISVASASELPDVDGIDDIIIHEGSGAWDISTGESYGWIDGSGWTKQPNGIPFNFYEEV